MIFQLIIVTHFVFAKTPFQEIVKHRHHIPCNQLQDAKEYLDMIEHKDQLIEDSNLLETYIGKSNNIKPKDLTMNDLEGINKLLEYYENTEDIDKRDQLLQDLYNQVVEMKNALDYELQQLDDQQYDHLRDLIDGSDCQDVQTIGSFQPLFKQDENGKKKERVRERIILTNNQKTIKLPRRRKHPKKYVITKKPYEWERDIINYDDYQIPDQYVFGDEGNIDDIDCWPE